MSRSMRWIAIFIFFGSSTTIISNQSWPNQAFKKSFLMLEKQAKHEAQIWRSGIKSLLKRLKGDSLTKYESIYFDAFKKRAFFTAAITLFSSLSTVILKIMKKRKTNRENIDLINSNKFELTPSQNDTCQITTTPSDSEKDENNTIDNKNESAKLNTKKKESDKYKKPNENNNPKNIKDYLAEKLKNSKRLTNDNLIEHKKNLNKKKNKDENSNSDNLPQIINVQDKKDNNNDGKEEKDLSQPKNLNKKSNISCKNNNEKGNKTVRFYISDNSDENTDTSDEESITDFDFDELYSSTDDDNSENYDSKDDINEYIKELSLKLKMNIKAKDDFGLSNNEHHIGQESYSSL